MSALLPALCILAISHQPLAFLRCLAATFPGNAFVRVPDSSGELSWKPATRALTIAFWFKISIPSGTNLTENMTLLVNRQDGDTNSPYAYLLRFNIYNGDIEFVTRGSSESFVKTLIRRPYLERWYHVAVKRSQSSLTGLVDGREVFQEGTTVGDGVANSQGVSIGGWNSGQYFYGDIQEVAIYQEAVGSSSIRDRMFIDLPTASLPTLKGYFKLGSPTNETDRYKNFAPNPPAGTEQGTKQGPGAIGFEETDQAGEQSLFDSKKNKGDSALASLSGSFAWSQTALARPTPGIAFDFQFGYASGIAFSSSKLGEFNPFEDPVLGSGWRHSFEMRIIPEQNSSERRVVNWDGSVETWFRTNNLYKTRHKEYRGELAKKTDASGNEFFEWTTPGRLVYRFLDPTTGLGTMQGQLYEIRDFNSNVVQILRDPNANGVVTQVVDTTTGKYDLRYNPQRQLTNIAFGAWQVNFTYDATNRLVSKTITNMSGLYASANTAWQFTYNATNGLLESITDPRSDTNLIVQYDRFGRKTNEIDALSRTNRTEYGVPGKRQMRRTDPAGFAWLETYDRKGRLLAQQDPLTNITAYTYDDFGNRTSITEPLGWRAFFGYDDRANVIARTNALGEITRWVFHSFFNKAVQQITPQPPDTNGWTTWTNFYAYDAGGNLTNHSDDLGDLVRYTYSTNGLVLTSTDANGHASRFTYNADGFLIARTDPATNTTYFDVNDVGWKLREINPLGDATAYSLDVNGNPVRVQDVLGRVFRRAYDPNGNLLSTTDGKGQLTTHAYDAANQRTNTTDRTGTNKWFMFYTLRGKVGRVTDPLDNSMTNIYDPANRLIRVTDPLGNSVANQYDANGNLTALLDKLGQRWSKTYDRLNRTIAETDPLGNTRATAYDIAGRLQQSITPNGYPSIHFYDGRGRLIKWHDAEDFDWLYAYDGVGNITNITDALGGHYVMAYGPRNERLFEQNQDTNTWHYAYDELLRLKRQTDPNGTTRTPRYDKAGRVLFVDYNTGRGDEFAYDANNNPQTLSRRASGVTTATRFIYDALDRPIEQTDAFARTVQYGYDPLGRVTALTYPGGKTLTNRYDALGRLTSQVDWASRQMIYAYDQADRLIRRTYPNGVSQTNTFDNTGRLTDLKYQISNPQSNSIAIALTYAYDKNGNKTGSSEKGTFPWPQPTMTDERSDYTAAGRLKTRSITPSATNAIPSPGGEGQGEGEPHLQPINYFYEASGNLTNATGDGQSWSLTYDEDNRTTSIHWDAGLTSKQIVNRYDALGRRISKTVDGVQTGYVLSLVGGMERILCDLDAAGNATSWYIHGPDLCYRVDTANNVVCYHADAMANVISLTDTNGNSLTQYAYTPYGRSLGSSSISNLQSQISNPYTFVGSQGVMEELPGLYFMRARYYSAEAGVFLSSDPVKKIGPGWNVRLYVYADGNPFEFVDPKGTSKEGKVVFSGLVFISGLVMEEAAGILEKSDRALDHFGGQVNYSLGNVSDDEKDKEIEAGQEFINDQANRGFDSAKKLLQKTYGVVQWAASDPITANGGTVANSTPMMSGSRVPPRQPQPQSFQLNLNVGGTGKPASQMVNGANVANGHATVLNQQQATPNAPNSNGTGTTTPTGGGGSGQSIAGNNAFTKIITSITQSQTYQSVTSTVKNVAVTVSQAVSSAVKSVGNFLSGLFGGRP